MYSGRSKHALSILSVRNVSFKHIISGSVFATEACRSAILFDRLCMFENKIKRGESSQLDGGVENEDGEWERTDGEWERTGVVGDESCTLTLANLVWGCMLLAEFLGTILLFLMITSFPRSRCTLSSLRSWYASCCCCLVISFDMNTDVFSLVL